MPGAVRRAFFWQRALTVGRAADDSGAKRLFDKRKDHKQIVDHLQAVARRLVELGTVRSAALSAKRAQCESTVDARSAARNCCTPANARYVARAARQHSNRADPARHTPLGRRPLT